MRRMISLVLSVLLVLALFPAAALGAEDVYQELLVEMPEGYESPSAMSSLPGGGFVAAALGADGKWALLSWSDLGAEPSILPIDYEGNDIEHLSIAPDGSILAVLSSMSPMRGKDMGMGNGGAGEPALGGGTPAEGEKASKNAVFKGAPPAGDEAGASAEGEGKGLTTFKVNMDDMKSGLLWLDQSGAVAARAEISGYVISAQALNGQRAAVLTVQDGLGVYDVAGNQLARIGLGQPRCMAADGESVYVLEDARLVRYDAGTGESIGSIPVEAGSAALCWAGDGHVAMMDEKGLYDLDFGAGSQVALSGSMGMMYGDPNNGIVALARLADGEYVALVDEGGGMGGGGRSVRIGGQQSRMLAGYQRRDDIDPSQRQDFTITALRDSARLQKAASDFQRLHPELNVVLQTQMSADDDSPTADHIRTLSTDLLAGAGGDVLVLDGLPAQKYAQRGILADIAETFQDIGLLPGVRAAATGEDGSMYAIPAQFSFDIVWGNSKNIAQLNSLADLAQIPLADGQTPFSAHSYEDWLELFYPASETALRNGAGMPDLGSAEFAAFLDALYALYETQDELPDDELVKPGQLDQMSVIAMTNGASAFYPARVTSLMDLTVGYTIAGKEDADCASLPTLNGLSRGLIPSIRLGINARTQQRALAEEFIRLMLSPEIQLMEMGEGLPTLASALDQQFADAIDRAENKNIMTMITFDGTNAIELSQPSARALNAIRELIDGLNEQILPDEVLMGFIVEECDAFFAGQRDAASTASAIGQRAWSYLNE